MERLLALMEAQHIEIPKPDTCDLYIAGLGDKAQRKAFELIAQVRRASLAAEGDFVGRSLRAQMKYADKIGAKFSVVLGDNEIETGKANLKNMQTGAVTGIALDETFFEKFFAVYLEDGRNTIINSLQDGQAACK